MTINANGYGDLASGAGAAPVVPSPVGSAADDDAIPTSPDGSAASSNPGGPPAGPGSPPAGPGGPPAVHPGGATGYAGTIRPYVPRTLRGPLAGSSSSPTLVCVPRRPKGIARPYVPPKASGKKRRTKKDKDEEEFDEEVNNILEGPDDDRFDGDLGRGGGGGSGIAT